MTLPATSIAPWSIEAVGAPGATALPSVEAVDALQVDALPAFMAYAAALQARAAMRLGGGLATAPVERSVPVNSPTESDCMLTAAEVGTLLNAKRAWVYRHRQQLGGEKLDGLVRFSRRRVLAYVERQRKFSG